MPKIPPVDSRRLIKILENFGFRVVRQKGSHVIMMNEEKTRIVIPVHPGRKVKPGLVRAIMREAELVEKNSSKFLKRNNGCSVGAGMAFRVG